jgi:citrate synthase
MADEKIQYFPGLEGVPLGETKICYVDSSGKLIYRGYSIHELIEKSTYEEVAYLILFGKLPNKS